jgi:DNA-binding Lrp family transcriptional regulator
MNMKTFKQFSSSITNKVINADQMSAVDKRVLQKLLGEIPINLEYRMPSEITNLDKQTLLVLVYRLLKLVKE